MVRKHVDQKIDLQIGNWSLKRLFLKYACLKFSVANLFESVNNRHLIHSVGCVSVVST